MNGSIGRLGIVLLVGLAALTLRVESSTMESEPPEQPQPERSRIELGLFTGVILPDSALVGVRDPAVEPTFGVRVGGGIRYRWSWFADLQLAPFETQTFAGDATMLSGRGGVEFLVRPGRRTVPFVSGGWGYAQMTFDGATDFLSAFASLGLGQHIQIGGRTRLRWEVRADRMLASNGLRGIDLTQPQATIGFNWVLGQGKLDHDRDGVPGHRDKCHRTPPGASVDRRGCPSDGDHDGVLDGLDACPETPREWPVGGDGCPTDTDGDGVVDGADHCASSPTGVHVDQRGCPIDTDGDGVFDGPDRCPRTLVGIEVDAHGCFLDADRDGVYDGLGMDRCPGTPAGTPVDASGCPL